MSDAAYPGTDQAASTRPSGMTDSPYRRMPQGPLHTVNYSMQERASVERLQEILADAGFGGTLPEPAAEMPHVPGQNGGFLIPEQVCNSILAEGAQAAIMATKLTAWVPTTAEELAAAEELRAGLELAQRFYAGTATLEERAEFQRNVIALKAYREQQHAEYVAEWQQVRARYADSPAVLAVLDIHQPDDERLECRHPVFGWESDAEDWPCSTYEAIKGAL